MFALLGFSYTHLEALDLRGCTQVYSPLPAGWVGPREGAAEAVQCVPGADLPCLPRTWSPSGLAGGITVTSLTFSPGALLIDPQHFPGFPDSPFSPSPWSQTLIISCLVHDGDLSTFPLSPICSHGQERGLGRWDLIG